MQGAERPTADQLLELRQKMHKLWYALVSLRTNAAHKYMGPTRNQQQTLAGLQTFHLTQGIQPLLKSAGEQIGYNPTAHEGEIGVTSDFEKAVDASLTKARYAERPAIEIGLFQTAITLFTHAEQLFALAQEQYAIACAQ